MTSRVSPGAQRIESPAGRSSRNPLACSRSKDRLGFASQNGKWLEMRIGRSPAVGHADRAALAIGDQRDVALPESHARLPGAERLAKHHEPGALVQQDLEPDLGDQLGDPVEHRRRRGDSRGRVQHLLPGGTASGGQVHLVAQQRDGLGGVQRQPAIQRRPGELGGVEDAEPIVLGRVQQHGRSICEPPGTLTAAGASNDDQPEPGRGTP